jgi:hypothetical protein
MFERSRAMPKFFARKLCDRALFAPFLCLLLLTSSPANATFHLWRITQLFSNADGTVQFIEITSLAAGQQFISGHTITSSQGGTTKTFTFASNLPDDSAVVSSEQDPYGGGTVTVTRYKSFIVATAAFGALAGISPDYVMPNGFLFTTNGTVNFGEGSDSFSYASLPTGSLALYRDGGPGPNSPKNFSGARGTLPASTSTAFALENPQPGSFQSGIGLVSGWSCQGSTITITVDGSVQLPVPYGSSRADTASACGGSNTSTGFGLLINFNLLGAGTHAAQLFVNGAPKGEPVQFTVIVPSGQFLTGAAATITVPNFPSTGKTTTLIWQEAQQNFAVRSVTP